MTEQAVNGLVNLCHVFRKTELLKIMTEFLITFSLIKTDTTKNRCMFVCEVLSIENATILSVISFENVNRIPRFNQSQVL